jgi:glycosyltransferase involved in cell wall biosynthesis
MVRCNPLAEISNYINFFGLRSFNLSSKIDLRNTPSNIYINKTPIIYLPLESQYKNLGHKHCRAVFKSIKDHNIKFDLIHSHFTWSSGFVGSILKDVYNVPFIVTAHGYDINSLPFIDNEWRQKIKVVLDTADYIITVSYKNKEYINKLNVKTPVRVLPNGYRKDLFFPMNPTRCREKLNLPSNKKIILTIGNFVEEKGYEYFIKALAEVVKTNKYILCIMIGDGILIGKIKKLIKESELESYVRLTGRLPHHEICYWINACDLFILPSISEGNPTVMFEALGCGKPIIGTNVGGIPEIIKSKEIGILCEPADSNQLALIISEGLGINWDCEKIANYSDNFKWEKIAKKINEIYTLISPI